MILNRKLINFCTYCTSAINNKPYFVTTPIYYVNAEPHLGHLYSSLLADVAIKWNCIKQNTTGSLFSTGTDEHGSKIQRAAEYNKKSPLEYCDEVSEKYKQLADKFHIGYTHFVRTTDPAHKRTVQDFWNHLDKNGHIGISEYKGWYCVQDETFLTESQLTEQRIPGQDSPKLVSIESGHPVEWCEERNYVFKSGKIRNDVLKWLRSNGGCIKPNEMQLRAERLLLEDDSSFDVSISRPVTRVPWGIPVPNDPNQTIYVWLDALCNYLTVGAKHWPPDIQILGKDILRFHAVLWPALLLAAGYEPPKKLFVHCHWTVDHVKMSKSRGNVINPMLEAETMTADGLRYFLLREAVPHSDANYSSEKARKMLNAELADTFGNLLSRCTAKTININQERPLRPNTDDLSSCTKEEIELCELLEKLPHIVSPFYEELEVRRVIDEIIPILHRANACVEFAQPWKLAKDETQRERLSIVLGLALEVVRTCTILLYPVLPQIATNSLNRLNVSQNRRNWVDACQHPWTNQENLTVSLNSNVSSVLFRRIVAPKSSENSLKTEIKSSVKKDKKIVKKKIM